ncbi:MAG: hypothetical protein GQ474_07865 [Sulfurimonas sp.]|nr:hypothetical protein [Sulfurimonas sp.]
MNIQVLAAVLVAGIAIGSTINGWYRDSKEHAANALHDAYVNEIAQGGADIVQEVLDDQDKAEMAWRAKYDRKIKELDATNTCRLTADSMWLLNEAINDASSQTYKSTTPLYPSE